MNFLEALISYGPLFLSLFTPTPDTGTTMGGGHGHHLYSVWKGGMRVLISEDHRSGMYGSQDSSGFFTYRRLGESFNSDTHTTYTWKFETTDGKRGTLWCGDKQYPIPDNSVVIISTRQGIPLVQIFKRDLKRLPPGDSDSLIKLFTDDKELYLALWGAKPK
jgi:hypothetical protein